MGQGSAAAWQKEDGRRRADRGDGRKGWQGAHGVESALGSKVGELLRVRRDGPEETENNLAVQAETASEVGEGSGRENGLCRTRIEPE
jgi:hypothetical protein